MPLDLGGVTLLRSTGVQDGPAPAPTLDFGADIGVALRAAREHRGLSIEELSDITRVRQVYLAAIEDMRLEELPSRPFVIGYLRAYAKALNLDDEAVVARFRAEHGAVAEPLREPIGVRPQRDPRLGVAIVAGVVIVAAIATWNVARRAMTADEDQTASAAVAPGNAASQAGASPGGPAQISLGQPLPAPVESTTPTPYVTPGLADAAAAGGSADAVSAAMKARAASGAAAPAVAEGPPPPSVFQPRGAILGTASPGPALVLQARRPASLVVSGADGSVYFARQLAEGEAYRAPTQAGMTAEVSDPTAFVVYVDNALRGVLPANRSPLAKLAAPLPQ